MQSKFSRPLQWFIGSDGAYVFFAYVLTLAVSFAATSKMFDRILGQDHLEIVNYNASPVEWLALVLAMCAFLRPISKKSHIAKSDGVHPWVQSLSLLGVGASISVAFILLHPSDETYGVMQEFLNSAPVVGGPILAALIATALILPFFPAYIFIAPKTALSRWKELLLVFLTLVGCFFIGVLEALYFSLFAPFIMHLLTAALLLFSSNVYVNVPHTLISIDGFRIVIGAACAGLGYMLLFSLFFAYFVFHLKTVSKISLSKTAIALLFGLIAVFFLNIFRIVTLMLVGRQYPEFALTLFHSMIGSVYFLLFFLLSFPLIRKFLTSKHG